MITYQQLTDVYKQSTIKNGAPEGFFNTFIFRRISIHLSWVFASLNIHPNIVSTLAFACNISGGILLVVNYDVYAYFAVGLILLGHTLDMSDGEVARLNQKSSVFGGFLDSLFDRVTDVALPLLLLFGHYLSLGLTGSPSFISLVILFVSIHVLQLYLDRFLQSSDIPTVLAEMRSKTATKSRFLQYIKWDGGLTAVLYTTAITLNLAPELIIFFALYLTFVSVVSILKITSSVNG
jgi:phosphatidylglycerophosphate synthase